MAKELKNKEQTKPQKGNGEDVILLEDLAPREDVKGGAKKLLLGQPGKGRQRRGG